jgi:hypothetical protein
MILLRAGQIPRIVLVANALRASFRDKFETRWRSELAAAQIDRRQFRGI